MISINDIKDNNRLILTEYLSSGVKAEKVIRVTDVNLDGDKINGMEATNFRGEFITAALLCNNGFELKEGEMELTLYPFSAASIEGGTDKLIGKKNTEDAHYHVALYKGGVRVSEIFYYSYQLQNFFKERLQAEVHFEVG